MSKFLSEFDGNFSEQKEVLKQKQQDVVKLMEDMSRHLDRINLQKEQGGGSSGLQGSGGAGGAGQVADEIDDEL